MITEGYSHYKCDIQGCENEVYALPDTDAADGYVKRRRIDAEGIERTIVLCPKHAAIYAQVVKTCDGAYAALSKTGAASLYSQADIDALQTKLDEAEKARKWWGDRYRTLQAEFDAYKETHPDTPAGADA